MPPLWKNHVWSWYGHLFVATMLPAAVMSGLKAFLIGPGFWSLVIYTTLVCVTALYYRSREEKDEAAYREKGTYDEAQAELTARIDTVGDLIGPYTAAIALLTGLTMFGPWWAPLAPVGIVGAYMMYETGRAAKG